MKILIALLALAGITAVLVFALKLVRALRDLQSINERSVSELGALKAEMSALQRLTADGAESAVTAACLSAMDFKFPVFLSGPSIDPHHAKLLLFVLQEKKPKKVLELGSGSSTILIARALKLLGATPELHLSVDHEARFLQNTIDLAAANDVAHLVRFECCPLKPVDGFANPWYSRLPEILKDQKLDLVLVDGPPAYEDGKTTAREPALAVLLPYLADDALIILDDANRPGESEVLRRWVTAHPELGVQRFEQGKGVALVQLNRKPSASTD